MTFDPDQLPISAKRLREYAISGALVPPASHAWDLSVLLDFFDAIPADRLNPWHTVTLDDIGWHLAHPITCDLSACPFDAEARAWPSAPADHGVYRWDLVDGPLIVAQADS